jgi:signal transduction histidine kinase
MRALLASRWFQLDCVFALVLTAIGVGSVFTTDPTVAVDYPPANAPLVLLAIGACLPVAFRRIYPYTALAISAVCISTIMIVPWNEGVTPLGTLALLYSVAVYRPTRVALAGLFTVLGMFTFFALIHVPAFDDPAGILNAAIFCVPWAIGMAVRRQRTLREEATQRALAAEREVAAAEQRAVFNERLRIARELHDVVAHTLSVVAVQAGVARHLMHEQPQRVEPALTAIEEASRMALDDLRRMLGVLREGPDDTSLAGLSPAPGLSDLEPLIAMHRESYGPAQLIIEPGVEQLPDSVRITVYRIVQEALTNARKHAPRAAVTISVAASDGDVTVVIENPESAQTTTHTAPGFGLVGMRERVGLFGGVLEAGPTEAGGFRVRAVLPGVARAGAPT